MKTPAHTGTIQIKRLFNFPHNQFETELLSYIRGQRWYATDASRKPASLVEASIVRTLKLRNTCNDPAANPALEEAERSGLAVNHKLSEFEVEVDLELQDEITQETGTNAVQLVTIFGVVRHMKMNVGDSGTYIGECKLISANRSRSCRPRTSASLS